MSPIRHHIAVIAVVFVASVAIFAAGVWVVGYRAALDQLERRGQADLALAADRLTSELQRSRELAVLLADHPALRPLVAAAPVTPAAVALLVGIADKTGARDIVLVDASGHEIVSARDAPAGNQTGQPVFERAMDGALGVGHSFSPRYGGRAFVFAAPIFSASGPVIGTVMVIADVEAVEASWRGDRPTVFFTDDLGVVFVSNRSELVFRTRRGDTPAAALAATYPGARIAPFVAFQPVQQGGHEIWNVDGGRYLPSRALHLTLELPVVGLTGEALLDVSPARQLATLQAAVAAALCLAFGALLLGATVRRQTLAEANARLEARVADRTAELVALNTALRREVAERTDAEARLHKAQADLVQAGKLSALGQMSAGISHELNQPLMAIRSFAENAEGFLARGKPDVAARNLSRISDLARRMGRIIRNLRAFARQESEPIGDVDLLAVIDAALEMVASKAHQGQVQIAWDPPAVPVIVRGGEVRLQQVILNLVSNAIDAMEEAEVRQVTISVASQGSRTEVTVADTGPGIAEPDRIFDPFYTTKQVGASEGVGLGLSISYGLVQSFGGVIRGRNAPTGGAIFTVELDASQTAVAA